VLIAHVGKERESGMRGAVTAFAHRLPLSAVKGTLESKKVKIQGLGTFYLTCECQKGGADKEQDFNVTQHLKALHIRFLPDQTAEDNISSREFIKKAKFVNIKNLLSAGTADTEEETSTDPAQGGGTDGNSGDDNTGSDDNTGGGPDMG